MIAITLPDAEHTPPRAKKSLAQHFLVDKRVLRLIVNAAEIAPDDVVVEIGAGRGILTRELVARGARVVAIELDQILAGRLENEFAGGGRVTVVMADARKVDLHSLVPGDTPYKIVANLPYYAASHIVRRCLAAKVRPASMVVMVQREVARSMAAPPGKMGLLSVGVQLYGKPGIVSYVPPRAFRPAPKVTSAIVRIDVYAEPAVDFKSEEDFFRLVKAAFSAPRKQIHNCIKQGLPAPAAAVGAMLSAAEIDPTRRAETLALPEWGRLYSAYRVELAPGISA